MLVANGEIYNYLEIRRDLLPDQKFRHGSDCEPHTHSLSPHGAGLCQCPARGMYALALWILPRRLDGARSVWHQTALLRRDAAGRGVCFGAAGDSGFDRVETRVRPEAARELLELQFTTGRTTTLFFLSFISSPMLANKLSSTILNILEIHLSKS